MLGVRCGPGRSGRGQGRLQTVTVLGRVLGPPRPALGEQLDIIPNHVCATVNLVDELVAGDVSWPVSARGENS